MNIGELAKFRGGIATDTISEVTSASGVTIDSVLCKDGNVTGAASGTFTTTYVKAADTQGLALVNSSGTSVVTVSDAGAVAAATNTSQHTFGSTGGAAATTILNVKTKSGSNAVLSVATNSAVFNITAVAGTDISLDDSVTLYKYAQITPAGAWTLGPSSGLTGTAQHTFNCSSTASTAGLNIIKPTGADSSSNYYINFTTNTTQQGYIWNDGSGNLVIATTSDASLKENIRPLEKSLEKISALKPCSYDWKSGKAKNCVGFIAQEFEDVFPRSVSDADGIKTVSFGPDFYATLVAAMKEQQAMIEELSAEVAALKAK